MCYWFKLLRNFVLHQFVEVRVVWQGKDIRELRHTPSCRERDILMAWILGLWASVIWLLVVLCVVTNVSEQLISSLFRVQVTTLCRNLSSPALGQKWFVLKMKAVNSSETFITCYNINRRHNPEDQNPRHIIVRELQFPCHVAAGRTSSLELMVYRYASATCGQ
jgi:hypothetical protein